MSKRTTTVLSQGTIAGFIAYLAAVVALGLLNVVQGRSLFHTAAAMGGYLFYGVDDPTQVTIAAGPVLAYNGVHLVGSLLVGTLGAFQITETERHPSFWYVSLLVLIAAAIYGIVAVGVLAVELGGMLDWSTAVVGTGVWILAMSAYLWWAHRGLFTRLQAQTAPE